MSIDVTLPIIRKSSWHLLGLNPLWWTCVLCALFVALPSASYAWHPSTHRILTRQAASLVIAPACEVDEWSLKAKLAQMSCLGILGEISIDYLLWELQNGGEEEDSSILLCRPWHHYQNPLLPLDKAGYSGLLTTPTCLMPVWDCLAVWAQRPVGWQVPGGGIDISNGNYSWHDAREYYYRGLTMPSPDDREKYLEATIRALGHIMHLVQDAAVPEHSRNDGHLFSIENFAKDNPDFIAEEAASTEWNSPYPPCFDVPANPKARVPIAQLFDSDLYTGENPEITPQFFDRGLAEYSNSNFFSGDTIWSEDFPYPNEESTDKATADNDDKRKYIAKVGDGEVITHFVMKGAKPPKFWRDYDLDDECYKDYLPYLIPRAVTYSALVPYYFFRGGMLSARIGTDSMTLKYEPDPAGTLMGREDLHDGAIEVYIEHEDGYLELLRSVEVSRLSLGDSMETDGIPEFNCCPPHYYPLYWIVYRGGLGEEDDAVIVGTWMCPC